MALTLGPSYATPDEWRLWKNDTPLPDPATAPDVAGESDLLAALRRASRVVDELLITEEYELDDDGAPVDPDIAATLAEATCCQHDYFEETGDPAGAGDYAGVRTNRHAPEAILALRRGGLLNPSIAHG